MKKNNTVDFQEGKLLPMIIRFSLPAAISLLITAIYNIVDRIFVGNYVGTSALAGLSICFPLSFMMIAFGLTCSAGGASLFSIFAGSDDREKMDLAFGNAIMLAIISELALTVLLKLLMPQMLKIFGVTDTAYPYAAAYYSIVIIGCIFQGLTFVLCDFVRVSGKPLLGMCVTGVGAISNIIFDALFVIVFKWGVAGAAYATVLGQLISMIFGIVLVAAKQTNVRVSRKIFRIDRVMSPKIISCGFAFWIAQIAMGFISLVYNGQLGKYGGDAAISVYAVISSIMTFVIMPASGISQGIQPIIGNNYGAGKNKRVMDTFYYAAILSVLITCIIWAFTMIFPKAIISAFGASEDMYAIGISGLRLNFCITPVLGFVMLATTFFQSLERPVPSIMITLLRQVVVLIPLIYVLPMVMGINGIFIAQPVSDGIAAIISIILILRERKILYSK